MTTLADPAVEDRPCCRDALLHHCHAGYVRHADEAVECTDAACDVPAEGHAYSVPCSSIEPECLCI